MLGKSSLSYIYTFAFMIDFVHVAWAWSTLSELLAYLKGSKFPHGQQGSDNRGWTVLNFSGCEYISVSQRFCVPLMKANVDLSQVQEGWDDMLEHSKQYVNLVQDSPDTG